MVTKIVLWIPDLALQSQISNILNESGFAVTLINRPILTNDDMKNWGVLVLHTDVLQQIDDIAPFLSKVRHVSKVRVLILSDRRFYPLISDNKLGISQWVDWVLYFPIDREELLGNVRRYLEYT